MIGGKRRHNNVLNNLHYSTRSNALEASRKVQYKPHYYDKQRFSIVVQMCWCVLTPHKNEYSVLGLFYVS